MNYRLTPCGAERITVLGKGSLLYDIVSNMRWTNETEKTNSISRCFYTQRTNILRVMPIRIIMDSKEVHYETSRHP